MGPFRRAPDAGNEALSTLSSQTYPMAALLEEIAILAIFAALLFLAQAAVRFWTDSDRITTGLSALLWLVLIISFKAPVSIPGLLRPVNYLVAYHARIDLGGVSLVMATAVLVIAAVVGISWCAERGRLKIGSRGTVV